MPVYPLLACVGVVAVVALELLVLRTGVFRDPAYWVALAICLAFMIPVDGWLTKLSAPIVLYRESDTQRPPSGVGHPPRGVRLRLRPAYPGDVLLGSSGRGGRR